jgi:hypothetical protein
MGESKDLIITKQSSNKQSQVEIHDMHKPRDKPMLLEFRYSDILDVTLSRDSAVFFLVKERDLLSVLVLRNRKLTSLASVHVRQVLAGKFVRGAGVDPDSLTILTKLSVDELVMGEMPVRKLQGSIEEQTKIADKLI